MKEMVMIERSVQKEISFHFRFAFNERCFLIICYNKIALIDVNNDPVKDW